MALTLLMHLFTYQVLDEDERIRVVVVEELLTSRLEETLTSRNSVHVWQKVLELNWTHPEFRRTIFAIMNQQMKGKWAQAARQETGSIICQNIFESADTDEKVQYPGLVDQPVMLALMTTKFSNSVTV